jgi:hypothetical protein
MGARHPNPRLIKIHRTYSVDEAARCLRVHKNTVRRWQKSGLVPVEGKGLTIFRGAELRAFLEERRRRAKSPCPPGTMYCLRCRAPKEPLGRMADLICSSPTAGNLRGLCPDCEGLMNRRVNLAKLSDVCGNLGIASPQHTAA